MKTKVAFYVEVLTGGPLEFRREITNIPHVGDMVFFNDRGDYIEGKVKVVHHLVDDDEVDVHLEVSEELQRKLS